MAESSTALAIVQAQQSVVGRSLVGATQAMPKAELGENSAVGILEQIREVTTKTFRKITTLTDTFVKMFEFQKNQSRLQREQATELAKEQGGSVTVGGPVNVGENLNEEIKEELDKQGGILNLLGLGGLMVTIKSAFKKILGPLLPFFKKFKNLLAPLTRLLPFLGRLGPIGLLITGFTLLFKYSDEIVKALTPAIESISKAFDSLKPGIDLILSIIDGGIKIAINAIGGAISGIALAIEVVAGAFSGVLDGIKQISEGNIIDGLKTILKSIIMAPVNLLKGLGNIIGDFFIGLIDALPLPKFIKDKFKGAVEKKETKTGSAGDMAGEASLTTGETIDTSEKSNETSQSLDDEYYENETVDKKEKPKTINQDKPKSMIEVVTKTTETSGESIETTGYSKEQKQSDMGIFTKKVNSLDDKIKSLEDQYGFPSFEVGNPDYDNAIADEAKDNPALGKAWRKYKALHREKFKTIEKIKEIEGRPLEEPEKMYVEKKKTKIETIDGEKGVTVINNSPTNVNQQSMAGKTDVTVVKLDTSSGDSYFDRSAYNQA